MLYDDGWVRIKSAYSAPAVSVVADMRIGHRIQSVRLQSLAPADVLFAGWRGESPNLSNIPTQNTEDKIQNKKYKM